MGLFGKRSKENAAKADGLEISPDQTVKLSADQVESALKGATSDSALNADTTLLIDAVPGDLTTIVADAGATIAGDEAADKPVYRGKHAVVEQDTATFSGRWDSSDAIADAETLADDAGIDIVPDIPVSEAVVDDPDIPIDDDAAFQAIGPAAAGGGTGIHVDSEGKKPFNKKLLFIILGIVLGVLVAAYIGTSIFFMSHFGFNTRIGDVDVSFMTVDDAKEAIAENAKSYKLEIDEREDKVEQIEGSAIDFAYTGDAGEVQAVLDGQEPFLFIARLWDFEKESFPVEYVCNADKLQAAVNALGCVTNPAPIAPANAYPEFDGTHYVAHPEVLGTTIDGAKLQQVIAAKVKAGAPTVDIDAEGCYVPPTVTTESPELAKRIEQLDKYTPFALTYNLPDGSTERLDGETIFDWLTIKEDGSYDVDNDKIVAWVEDFANRHSTVGHKRVFTSVDGETYEVEGGTYGWNVDQDTEVEGIWHMLETKESQTREPYWLGTAAVVTKGEEPDWGNTYIELNLTAQHMFYVENGEKVFEADVVTGLPGSRATPAGVWSILEVQRDRILRGEMTAAGVPEYETPVSYWMRMTWSGVGFHDAIWQPWFGGERYTYAGSHGCINMSYSDAQELFQYAYVGLPVVSHY